MAANVFRVERQDEMTLQAQIRENLVDAMLSGQFPPGAPVPSTRSMAERLRVSRNTVMLAYQALASDGFLVARERSGFYVSPEIGRGIAAQRRTRPELPAGSDIDWEDRFRRRPAAQPNITKPRNWHDHPYPFIYGQADAGLFPVGEWRDCVRQAMSRKWLDDWTRDHFAEDDPMLIDQIRQRILTRRGIVAGADEILVTMGAQNALYLIASLLTREGAAAAVEDPGYPDLRNMLALMPGETRTVPVDGEGVMVDQLGDARLAFVTPSHQFPTNATMSRERRRALLDWADRADALIVEDDYEFETNYRGEPMQALKSLDRQGRVLYVGSLSKSLMPGLRMGFMVGPASFIAEARAMRRLMLRHPPGNNQRVVALFLALGHHDALVGRLHRAYAKRWEIMGDALTRHLPGWGKAASFGGSCYWVEGPECLDTRVLAASALEEGVVIEPGDIHFAADPQPRHFLRLGFSSIGDERIEPGIARLAQVAQRLGAPLD